MGVRAVVRVMGRVQLRLRVSVMDTVQLSSGFRVVMHRHE